MPARSHFFRLLLTSLVLGLLAVAGAMASVPVDPALPGEFRTEEGAEQPELGHFGDEGEASALVPLPPVKVPLPAAGAETTAARVLTTCTCRRGSDDSCRARMSRGGWRGRAPPADA